MLQKFYQGLSENMGEAKAQGMSPVTVQYVSPFPLGLLTRVQQKMCFKICHSANIPFPLIQELLLTQATR